MLGTTHWMAPTPPTVGAACITTRSLVVVTGANMVVKAPARAAHLHQFSIMTRSPGSVARNARPGTMGMESRMLLGSSHARDPDRRLVAPPLRRFLARARRS
jgi:hypothetical protein